MIEGEKKELPASVTQNPPPLNYDVLPRIRHIFHLESLVNVGCKFLIDDLSPDEWDQLITLAVERQWIQKKLRDKTTPKDAPPDLDQKALQEREKARSMDKLPPTGGTIFPQKKPIR